MLRGTQHDMARHVMLSATKHLWPAVVQPLGLPLPNLLMGNHQCHYHL